jgi:antitoxin (DNA-binding transcriptional repressor) of toxin-antitoxin stability system
MATTRRRETLEVTVRGRVIARIVPEEDPTAAARERLKALRGKARITGDIISPLAEHLEAESGHT